MNTKLHICKIIRQSLEQGQNKLRYALELKEKVIMNTEQNGAQKIEECTEALKTDFEKLLGDVEDCRQKLSARATVLEELNKLHRILSDWIEETESKVHMDEEFRNDLGEKRALLEKYKIAQRDIANHSEIVEKLKSRLAEVTQVTKAPYEKTITAYDELRKATITRIKNLENQVKEHEQFQQAFNEASDWTRKAKVNLQQHTDTHGEKDQVIEREKKLNQIVASLPVGQGLISKVIELSEQVIATTGSEGQELINQDIDQLQQDWGSLQAQCQESQKLLSDCIITWSQFTSDLDSMKKWLDNFQNRISDEQVKENKTLDDLERCKKLVDEANRQKSALEDINDKCEILLEMSACSSARDKTVQLQSIYTKLLTDAQGLVTRVEKNLSDQTEFLKAKKDLEEWLFQAHNVVQGCAGVGNVAWAREKLDTLKSIAARVSEGQHLMQVLQSAFTKAINIALPEQQDQLRTDVAVLRSSWDQLTMDLNTIQAQVKSVLSRWEDHGESFSRLDKWLADMEQAMNTKFQATGELSEMKTQLERNKHVNDEALAKKSELDHLMHEAAELSHWAKEDNTLRKTKELLERWKALLNKINQNKFSIEEEIQMYNAYHTALQETEKWLLQISFQLMAHNSLYITNKDQTIEQIQQHAVLLKEIEQYKDVLDDLKDKGLKQILLYESYNPTIKNAIETQLKNVNESYNSLLSTAVQIKVRLNESLAKFNECENVLASIMKNLDEYEPEVVSVTQSLMETLEAALDNLNKSRALHNKLQNEKSRLALAIEACETAAACVSRPGSPLDAPPVQSSPKELEVRNRLEDLIDQVKELLKTSNCFQVCLNNYNHTKFYLFFQMQVHLSNVTKSVSQLEEQSRQKNALRAWINQQRVICAEWNSRPAKLRVEAAQAELQSMNDLLSNVGERRVRAQTELSLKPEEDDDIEESLDKLELELIEAIAGKNAAQDLIKKYRSQVQDMQNWFDALSKRADNIEKGNGLTINQKISAANEISDEFESRGPEKFEELKKLAEQVMDSVSNLDSQQIEEQLKSVERKYGDLRKKILRKCQVLETTAQGIKATKKEIEELRNWISEKKQIARDAEPLGFESKQAEEKLLSLKAILKEAEGKQVIIDTLEKRVGNMQNELESSEQEQLESDTRALRGEQAELCSILREEISAKVAAVEGRRKFEDEVDRARNWIKLRSNDSKKLSGYLPLKASKVEQEVAQHNNLLTEIRAFNEDQLKSIFKQGNALLRECDDDDKNRLQNLLDLLKNDYDELQKETKEKQAALADLLQGRKAFENEIDKCNRWIKEAEVATSSELRSSSVDVLKEQLAKVKQ